MIEKVESFMTSIMENGIERFYWSNAKFLVELRNSMRLVRNDETHGEAITLEHLQIALITYLSLMILATIVFGLEILFFHLKRWWQQQLESQILFPFTN